MDGDTKERLNEPAPRCLLFWPGASPTDTRPSRRFPSLPLPFANRKRESQNFILYGKVEKEREGRDPLRMAYLRAQERRKSKKMRGINYQLSLEKKKGRLALPIAHARGHCQHQEKEFRQRLRGNQEKKETGAATESVVSAALHQCRKQQKDTQSPAPLSYFSASTGAVEKGRRKKKRKRALVIPKKKVRTNFRSPSEGRETGSRLLPGGGKRRKNLKNFHYNGPDEKKERGRGTIPLNYIYLLLHLRNQRAGGLLFFQYSY